VSSKPLVVLLDEQGPLYGAGSVLRRQPYRLFAVRTAEEAFAVLQAEPVALLAVSQQTPDGPGSDVMRQAADRHPNVGRLLISNAWSATQGDPNLDGELPYAVAARPTNPLELLALLRANLQSSLQPLPA
jgi:hypothetical protein